MDLAHLGIKVEYKDIDKAIDKLKELERTGARVQKQSKNIKFPAKSNTELDKITKELKAINKQAQILGEASSVSAREVDRLTAKLKYLQKQVQLRNLGADNNLQRIIKNTENSINSLTGKIKKSDSALKRWWKRFGEVGLGFTLIYQTVNMITGALGSLQNVLVEGIKQSGELAATQAKLAMWISFATKNSIGFAQAMQYAGQQTQALSDVALTSMSTLDELASALDELGQAQVIISPKEMKNFADLVDFTKLVAQTTGSTTRQIRQEIQALMQGEMRTTNILIRTAKNLGILTEQDIDNLKRMQNRYEILTKLSAEISKYMKQTKEYILSADVGTVFEKWEKALVRIVSKSVQLTSYKSGTANIFGKTLYKHFDNLVKKINELTGDEYSHGLLFLNHSLDVFLTASEKAVTGTLKLIDILGRLEKPLSIVGKTLTGILRDLTDIAGVISTDLADGINKVFEGINKDKSSDFLKYAAEVALAKYLLKGKGVKGILPAIIAILGLHIGKKILEAPSDAKFGGLGWEESWTSKPKKLIKGLWELKMEGMAGAKVRAFQIIDEQLKSSLKIPEEINKFAQTIKERIKTPEQQFKEFVSKLQKAQKYGLLTKSQVITAKTQKMIELGWAGQDSKLVDSFMLREEGMKKAAKRAQAIFKERYEERKRIAQEFAEEYKKVTLSQYDYERYELEKTIKEYKKAGVDEIKLEEYKSNVLADIAKREAEERLRQSKYWKDGAIRALNDYAESAANMAKGIENVLTNAFNNLEDTLTRFVTTGKASFSDLVNSILADLARLTIRQTITAPLAAALSAGLQSGFGALFRGGTATTSSTTFSNLRLTGGTTTSPYSSLSLGSFHFATGGVFLNSSNLSAYRNSIVNKPTLFTFASGMGLMGEAGPEAVIPLTRTSSGDLGVKAEVAPLEINIIDQRSANSAPVEVTEQNVDGKKQIRILIKNELESMMVRGELDGVFRQSYGLNRRAY